MTTHEFNKFLQGPLSHPLPMFTMQRLIIALKVVVDATGEAGEKALREHCQARQEKDEGDADQD
jgi:hypothetical protein